MDEKYSYRAWYLSERKSRNILRLTISNTASKGSTFGHDFVIQKPVAYTLVL